MAKKDFQEILFIESARRPFLRLGRAVLEQNFLLFGEKFLVLECDSRFL
jgi:hypothetical protein